MPKNSSEKAYKEALKYIPGGVNSPVRALRNVEADPIFVRKASKASFTDLDGKSYVDFCLSWGVFILGHQHPKVNQAARKAIGLGSSYGIPTESETELAKLVTQLVPSIEQVRFVSSGTEAVMSAVRVARGYTGRNLLVKFDGCYHGHADHLLVSAGSGAAGLNESSSAGVPADVVRNTISLPFNNIEAVERLFSKRGSQIAAVIVEPIPANMGVVLPKAGFLEVLRKLTTAYGALLIFDEVITGFRLGLGGAQERLGIKPDLTTLGKIVGGGFPAAAFGGKQEIMAVLAPDGPVYQAGTLSGNPVAMAAGIQTLRLLQAEGFYQKLEAKTNGFLQQVNELIQGKDVVLNQAGSLFTLFFSNHEINNFEDVQHSDLKRFGRFYRNLLKHNIYFSPSPYEANFLSAAHTEAQLTKTLNAIKLSL